MQNDTELDQMQSAYKAAVEEWIAAIKQEEALASVIHSVAEVDKWEAAHFTEDKIRSKVKAAKKKYEDALLREVLWLLNRNNCSSRSERSARNASPADPLQQSLG
jgi:hypothetical protein